jgi:hypothetical protein
MRDSLARELLAKVTDWSPDKLTTERLDLQLLADYKYDEYQQFTPGMRFIENLSLWLEKFKDSGKQEIAYNFIKQKLIFISTKEMNQLIRMVYPDVIKPYLIQHVSEKIKIDEIFIKKILNDIQFEITKRKCLFLGLSDGARLDLLRRFSLVLKHEQVYPIYLITKDKAKELKQELDNDIHELTKVKSNEKYEIIFLIDDFSASGISYIREDSANEFTGKITKFFEQIIPKEEKAKDYEFIHDVIDFNKLKICVILYIATSDSLKKIKNNLDKLVTGTSIQVNVYAVQVLEEQVRLNDEDLGDFVKLMKDNFDSSILTEQYKKGKHDKPYLGFNESGLPLVLSHNCPNNSLPILWHESPSKDIRALFPRLQRYKVL